MTAEERIFQKLDEMHAVISRQAASSAASAERLAMVVEDNRELKARVDAVEKTLAQLGWKVLSTIWGVLLMAAGWIFSAWNK